MPEIDQETMGGNMRLGARPTVIRSEIDRAPTLASTIYSVQDNAREGKGGDNDDHERWILERHRHRYEVNPSFISAIEDKGLYFTGKDTKSERMEIAELPQAKHPFYFGVQFHPEFKSRPNRPSPPFFGFVVAALRYEDSHHAKKDGEANDGKVSTGKRNLSEAGQLFQLHEQDTSPYKKMKRSFSGLIKNFI
jgi:CTP synthase